MTLEFLVSDKALAVGSLRDEFRWLSVCARLIEHRCKLSSLRDTPVTDVFSRSEIRH